MRHADTGHPRAELTRRLNARSAVFAAAVLAATLAPPAAAAEVVVTPEPQVATGVSAIMEKVDAGFQAAVDGIAAVLFYELFPTDLDVLTYERSEVYVRSPRSADPFKPIAPDGAEFAAIDVQTAAQLNAEGRLLPGQIIDGDQRYYSRGTVTVDGTGSDNLVEYLQLKQDAPDPRSPGEVIEYGSSYKQWPNDDLFARVSAMRSARIPEDTLTAEQVEALADQPGFTLETTTGNGVPIVVLWLFLGACFFTLRMGFVNVWAFGHAINVVRGKYDDPNEPGEVTHAQALASALSATVGLGNISGVAIAIVAGGPGAFFWMMVAGLVGMSSKFTECTLAQKYRTVKEDGTILGGPMRYLREGLSDKGLRPLGVMLGVVFSIMCVLASFGGGNMYQVNQAADQFATVIVGDSLNQIDALDAQMAAAAADGDGAAYEDLAQRKRDLTASVASTQNITKLVYGVVMAACVGLVIVGGMKRIGATAGKIVPTMCAVYIIACLVVIGMNLPKVPEMFALIFREAFSGRAVGGGFLGALIVATLGIRRAAFSNEAGVGSAAIAHAAAKTDEPVREGCVALLEPFIDTVVVCSMTALVILFTGVWDDPALIVDRGLNGTPLTSAAFEAALGGWFKFVLAFAVILFAFSTIISWSYYGERAWEDLFGPKTIPLYKALAIGCVVLGAVVNLGAVLDFSDMMILSMAFPNILGVVILSGLVKADLNDYWRRLKSGELDVDHSGAPATDVAPADV